MSVNLFSIELSKYEREHFNRMSEDGLIVSAIFYEYNEDYVSSQKYYSYLYNKTLNDEYLYHEVTNSIYTHIDLDKNIIAMENMKNKYPNNLKPKRLLISLYMSNKEYYKSKSMSNQLLEYSQSVKDLEFVADTYLYLEEKDYAIKLLNKAYNKNFDENIILRIVSILVSQNKIKEAIKRLETHKIMHNNNVSSDLIKSLINLYASIDDGKNLIKVYKELYINYEPTIEHRDNIVEIYLTLNMFNDAIDFLETYGDDEVDLLETLYGLYKKVDNNSKALDIARKIYKKQKSPKWLAEMGILLFEESKNDKTKISKMINYFEKALALGVNDALYLNFYGYTLIDLDLDLDKGINLIQEALKIEPNNIYYLDSLAWGYYKKRECQKADDIIKKIFSLYSNLEDDIKEHFKEIENCN
ncbi:hypothetical protein MNB_SV-15-695 [hydrothermal vent metagenome]|uniref:Uncharacterized protein n=1 Tax=hydrothermal vent metagenome TaxID=652676 RepID=A0A1W1EIH9_9ZZZZ